MMFSPAPPLRDPGAEMMYSVWPLPQLFVCGVWELKAFARLVHYVILLDERGSGYCKWWWGGERGEEVESSCLSNGRHAALLKTPDAFTEYAPLFSVRVASPVLNRSLCYRKPEDYGDRVLCGNTWKAYETSGCAPVLIVMEERGGASLGMSERCGGDNQRRHWELCVWTRSSEPSLGRIMSMWRRQGRTFMLPLRGRGCLGCPLKTKSFSPCVGSQRRRRAHLLVAELYFWLSACLGDKSFPALLDGWVLYSPTDSSIERSWSQLRWFSGCWLKGQRRRVGWIPPEKQQEKKRKDKRQNKDLFFKKRRPAVFLDYHICRCCRRCPWCWTRAPGMVETLSIAVIGAPGVGKTSIIRQFIYNDFSEVYTPTRTRYVYRPSVILNGNMYELKILDVPPISSFPSSSSQVSRLCLGNFIRGGFRQA